MMEYLDTETQQYPIQLHELQQPNTSYPSNWQPPSRYQIVFPAPPPAYDRITETVRLTNPVLTDKGHYEQVYEILPLDIDSIRANTVTFAEQLIEQVKALHQEKLYSDVTAVFPAGVKEIQFRDEVDRTNLSDVSQVAMGLIMAGQATTLVVYRTKDNQNQTLTAEEMVSVAMGVFQEKQDIVTNMWIHKDTIRALSDTYDLAGLRDYDVTTGW